MDRRQQGFTLIELMVVVAVIGILAALAVTYFGRTQKTTKAKAEVATMFAEIKVKQEQAMLEVGSYQDCNAGNDETVFFPGALAGNGNTTAVGALPATWLALGVTPPTGGLLCQYQCVHGASGAAAVAGVATAQFGYVAPAADAWYYMIAQCDMDSNAGLNSFYFESSSDNALAYINQGN